MVSVKLKLLAVLSEDVGLTQIEYSNVKVLGDVIDKFIDKHGKKLRKSFVDPKGNLESHVVIMVNGRNYLFLEGLKTKLNDGDEVVISPPLVGGWTLTYNISKRTQSAITAGWVWSLISIVWFDVNFIPFSTNSTLDINETSRIKDPTGTADINLILSNP